MSCATCALVSPTQKVQGMRQHLLGMGTQSTGSWSPWPLWRGPPAVSGTVSRAGGAGQPKDILLSQHSPSNALSRSLGRCWQVGTSLSSPSRTWLWHRPHRHAATDPQPLLPHGCFPRLHAKAAPTSHFKQTLMALVMDVLDPSTKPAMVWSGIQRRKRPEPGQEVQETCEGAE